MEKQMKDKILSTFEVDVQDQAEITRLAVEVINGMTKEELIRDLVGGNHQMEDGEITGFCPDTYYYHLLGKGLKLNVYDVEGSNTTIEECGKGVDHIIEGAKKQK